jgi:catechol 2,3-dioxygenase-like lactoylglutathione lyase family enzyme
MTSSLLLKDLQRRILNASWTSRRRFEKRRCIGLKSYRRRIMSGNARLSRRYIAILSRRLPDFAKLVSSRIVKHDGVNCRERLEGEERVTGTLAQNVFQIGFVVPDIHKGMAFFKDKLGVPEFLFLEDPGLEDETYLGKPAPLTVHLAFGWCGDTQIELIEPIAGVSTYSKFLDHNPQGGMHHYCAEVGNYAQGVKDMESRGFPLVQSG